MSDLEKQIWTATFSVEFLASVSCAPDATKIPSTEMAKLADLAVEKYREAMESDEFLPVKENWVK
jgi:hypothetical protein